MQKSRVRRVGALIVGLSLVAAACGGDDDDAPVQDSSTESTADSSSEMSATSEEMSEGTSSDMSSAEMSEESSSAEMSEGSSAEGSSAEAPAGNGELAGMRGTTPKAGDVSDWIPGVNEFWVAQGNEELTDFNYAAESYDAVIVMRSPRHRPAPTAAHSQPRSTASPVAARSARRSSTAWPSSMPVATSTTTASPARTTSTATASRSRARYAVLEFGADNRLDESLRVPRRGAVPRLDDRRPDSRRRRARRRRRVPDRLVAAGDGQPCLPRTTRVRGCRVSRSTRSTKPVVYWASRSSTPLETPATQRPTSPPVTSDRLIGEGVDAIIGAASSSVCADRDRQDHVGGRRDVQPGQHQRRQLTDYADHGLYFRNAPPDGLQGASCPSSSSRTATRRCTSSFWTTPMAPASRP